MKQSKIVTAYKVLNKLYGEDLPVTVSYKLYKVRNMLTPQWKFQTEKEKAVFDKYNPIVSDDGNIKFENDEQANAFMQEFTDTCNTLADMDIDLEPYEKVVINMNDKINLSMEDIEALQDFIDFAE